MSAAEFLTETVRTLIVAAGVLVLLIGIVSVGHGWDRCRVLLGTVFSPFGRRKGFAAPVPSFPHAVMRIVDLLLPYRYPDEQPSALRELHIERLIEDTLRRHVPHALVWRWGRDYGPEALLAALEVGLSRDEWLAPYTGPKRDRRHPDVSGLMLLAALTRGSQPSLP